LKLQKLNIRPPKKILLFCAMVLLLLSSFSSAYFSVQPSVKIEEKKLEQYIHRQQKNYEHFLSDSQLMRRLVQQTEPLTEFKKIADKDYGIFLFAETVSGDHEMLFWNNQKIIPPQADYSLEDGEYFRRLSNGHYLVVKKTIRLSNMSNNVIAYAMIPIRHEYNFPNSNYLQTHFTYDKSAVNKISISDEKTPYAIHSLTGKALFYIEHKAYTPIRRADPITSFLRVCSFILLLAYLHFVTESIAKNKGSSKGILFLLLSLLAVRIALYFFPGIFFFRQFELFDPTIYGNYYNRLNQSLGDLLINAVFFCWIVVYTWHSIGSLNPLPHFIYGKRVLVAGIAALLLLIISTFEYADIIRSLISDSKISFNVIDFFSLDIYTVVGFVVLALLSLSYYYFTRILFRFILPAFKNRMVYIYFALALGGLILLTFRSGNSIILFHLPVLLWLLIYTLILSQENFIINRFRITVAGILFWIFIFSVSLATLILKENGQKELRIRKSIAEKHDQLTDPAAEQTLKIALAFLDNDFLAENFHRFKNPAENRLIRDSIISKNFVGYIIKYDTRIFVFDSVNASINNDDPLTFAELNNLFSVQSKSTGTPDLNYHETSYDQFTYITKRSISDTAKVGSFFIVSTPKQYSSDALYPELFRNINQMNAENSPVYSHAVYKKNVLITASNKYPFPINLTQNDIPQIEFENRINEGYNELWYKAGNDKVVVVAKKQNSLIESITLFSYLFCAFLFMVGLLQIISIALKAANDKHALTVFWQLNIRSQVHSTIIFISILSFLIIGIATISFFITRYNRNNVDKLSRTAGIMVKEMQKQAADFGTFDDVIRIYDSVSNNNLQHLIDEVADIHDVDVNVYDTVGNLYVSSESEVYKKGLLSTKMHPEAYYHLNRLRQVQYVQEETLSSLHYLSIYATVRREDDGTVLAYLNIPYFLSQIDINQEISNFLVTIINLNAFIFLIAGIIALFITNKITRSFSIIGDKMKEIQLGKMNEEIIWNRNDEIGELVLQYNKMVNQLEQSAAALAKSEREGAWREMARQVAHEIKNPLTPMKLSIQYLQKAIHKNQPNVKELTTSVANTLVEQIDHLSKIAADFARFANIGTTQLETFDLHQVLQNLKDLYSSNPKIELKWKKLEEKIILRADKTHMNRLFTNLLTNSIDACTNESVCKIEIIEERSRNEIIVQIRDNGEGIPEEMQSKIFTPNFTTKSSGTGLGLAMCKSIVEQTGGEIWFKTAPGKGSSFFVQLPVVANTL
jgi:signal transduction histidine kinase